MERGLAGALVALAFHAILPETVAKDAGEDDDVEDNNGGVPTSDDNNNEADWVQLLQTSPTWHLQLRNPAPPSGLHAKSP